MNGQVTGQQTLMEAIGQVEGHADSQWMLKAHATVFELARAGMTFTSDEVWAVLNKSGLSTHEPRALGAVMLSAIKDGIIKPTGSYRKSTRAACHRRPLAVYESKIA